MSEASLPRVPACAGNTDGLKARNPMNLRSVRRVATLGAALVGALVPAGPANACGGLFCSQAAALNQSAERIIFSNDGNGTVTAVIQIMYQGPSENFSWLLPIPA